MKQLSRQISRTSATTSQILPKEETFSKIHDKEKLKITQTSLEKMTKKVRKITPEGFATTYIKFQEFELKKKEKIDKIKLEQQKDKEAEFIGKPTLIAKKQQKSREPLVNRIDEIIKNKEDKLKVKREEKQKQKEEIEAAISFRPKINENIAIIKLIRNEGMNELSGTLIKTNVHHECINFQHSSNETELFKPKINKFSLELAVFCLFYIDFHHIIIEKCEE